MRGVWRLQRLGRQIAREARILSCRWPVRVACNVCGWRGRCFFGDAWHPFTLCPRCVSHIRHRLFVQAIDTLPALRRDALFGGKRILHIAPEQILRAPLASRAARYVTCDPFDPTCDLQLDLCRLEGIADGSFDALIACDVLEHVPDVGRALAEILRVLAPGGWAVLTVPQRDSEEHTYEDASIVTPEGRTAAFGQEDHLRIFGSDFPVQLQAAGFRVTAVGESNFAPDVVRRFVLFPPVLSPHPLATNHRKVFFAQKLE